MHMLKLSFQNNEAILQYKSYEKGKAVFEAIKQALEEREDDWLSFTDDYNRLINFAVHHVVFLFFVDLTLDTEANVDAQATQQDIIQRAQRRAQSNPLARMPVLT